MQNHHRSLALWMCCALFIVVGCGSTRVVITGRIVYTSNRTGNMDVYLMQSNGTETNLTHDSDDQRAPVFSPDGNTILFTTYRVKQKGILYTIDVRDVPQSEPTQLIDHENTDANAVFSPGGSLIAFDSISTCSTDQTPNFDVFVMHSDGSELRQLTDAPEFDTDPDWSSDGSQLVFYSERDDRGGEIYRMLADGSQVVRLTNNTCRDRSPAWSPDGTHIAFVSECDDRNGDIYLMNTDGSHVTRLTVTDATDGSPAWSPDGSQLLFVSNREDNNMEIYRMDRDGTNIERLTHSDAIETTPYWIW